MTRHLLRSSQAPRRPERDDAMTGELVASLTDLAGAAQRVARQLSTVAPAIKRYVEQVRDALLGRYRRRARVEAWQRDCAEMGVDVPRPVTVTVYEDGIGVSW